MKLTVFFIMVINLSAFANVYSQTKITVDFKDAELGNVLANIQHNSSYNFVYSNNKIRTDKKVTIKAINENVTDVLGRLLGNLGLEYKELDNNLIAIAPAGHIDEYTAETQQGFKVSGLITDVSTGETLIGATVKVKGRQTAVAVDVAGKFTIEAPNSNSILVVNYVGYTEQEVPIDGKSVLDIKMSRVTTNLEEVVVTGFGLTTKKATLSGAISTVTADELAHSRSTSASGALVGRTPGINFRQADGRPGSAPDVQIRNFGPALIVIDGVNRDQAAFNALDFNDIESISVLKDASAAIYGMLASNGVVVITTKKGKRGQKPTISVNSYYGLQTLANFNKPADVKTYIKALVQSETYGNGVTPFSRTITREQYDKWMAGTEPGYQGFDWYKYIYVNAPQNYNSINFNGGSENVDYYVSIGNLIQKPMFRDFGPGYTRTNFTSNVNATVSKRIKIGVQVQGRLEKNGQSPAPGDDYDFAAQTAYRNLPTLSPSANPLFPAKTANDYTYSYGLLNRESAGLELNTTRFISVNGNLEISILPGLKARALGSYAFTANQLDLQRKSPAVYVFNQATGQYALDPTGFNESRALEHDWRNTESITTNFQLEYKRSFGRHNIQANAGMETRSNFSPRMFIQGAPAANNIAYIPPVSSSWVNITDDVSFKSVRHGYIGRVSYDYAGKYIAEVSGRYDGSPGYAADRRYGFFPSGSVGYRVSEEGFWKASSFLSKIDDFKVRASYGVTGREIGSYGFLSGYTYNQGIAILNGIDVLSSTARGLPTPFISWGRTQTLNIGADITLLRNRLSGTFEYFNREQKGDPAARADALMPDEVGFAQPNENLNSDITRGIEFSLNWKDKIGSVGYFISGNFTFSRWITGIRYRQRFSSDFDRYRNPGNDSGRWRDGTFQYISVGQFQSWEQINNHPIDQDNNGNRTLKPGDYIYQDVNNDGYINAADQKIVTYRLNGNNNGAPYVNFAFSLGGDYKGFDLRADFVGGTLQTFSQGGYLRQWQNNQNLSQYLADNSTWYNDIWDRNSGFRIGQFPLLYQGASGNTYSESTAWQTNVSYVKLRNLEIGYTIPYTVLKRVGISNFRVYLAGQNLKAFSNMPTGVDPEATGNGGTQYPNPRIYTLGAQIKF